MSTHLTWTDRLAARWPATVRERAAAAGVTFGVVALLVALVIAGGLILLDVPHQVGADPDRTTLSLGVGAPLAAGLAAAAIGTLAWWKLIEQPDEPTSLRGGLVGVAVGVLAHPLLWLLFGFGWLVVNPGGVDSAESLAAAVKPLFALYVAFTVVSMFLGGLVTVPVAVATGVALARLRDRAPIAVTDVRRPVHV